MDFNWVKINKHGGLLLALFGSLLPAVSLAQQYYDPGLLQKTIDRKPGDFQSVGVLRSRSLANQVIEKLPGLIERSRQAIARHEHYRYLLLNPVASGLNDKITGLDQEMAELLRDQTLLGWKIKPRLLIRAIDQGRIRRHNIRDLPGGRNDRVLQEMEVSLGRAVQ